MEKTKCAGTGEEVLDVTGTPVEVLKRLDEYRRSTCNLKLENRDLRERLEKWEQWKEGLPRMLCDIAEAQEELEPEYVRVLETALFEMAAGSRDLAMAISNIRELMSDVSACISEAVKLSTAPAERSGS
jgi:hypothetical protein